MSSSSLREILAPSEPKPYVRKIWSKGVVLLVLMPCAAAGSLHRLLLEKADIRQLANDTGVASLLEREGHDMALGARDEQGVVHS